MQEQYAEFVKDTFGSSVQIYNQEYLKQTGSDGDTSARLWWFQVCTEVAYFQVVPSNDSVRSSIVDTRHVFGCQTFISVFFCALYPILMKIFIAYYVLFIYFLFCHLP